MVLDFTPTPGFITMLKGTFDVYATTIGGHKVWVMRTWPRRPVVDPSSGLWRSRRGLIHMHANYAELCPCIKGNCNIYWTPLREYFIDHFRWSFLKNWFKFGDVHHWPSCVSIIDVPAADFFFAIFDSPHSNVITLYTAPPGTYAVTERVFHDRRGATCFEQRAKRALMPRYDVGFLEGWDHKIWVRIPYGVDFMLSFHDFLPDFPVAPFLGPMHSWDLQRLLNLSDCSYF